MMMCRFFGSFLFLTVVVVPTVRVAASERLIPNNTKHSWWTMPTSSGNNWRQTQTQNWSSMYLFLFFSNFFFRRTGITSLMWKGWNEIRFFGRNKIWNKIKHNLKKTVIEQMIFDFFSNSIHLLHFNSWRHLTYVTPRVSNVRFLMI